MSGDTCKGINITDDKGSGDTCKGTNINDVNGRSLALPRYHNFAN